MNSPEKVTAKKMEKTLERIGQGDIFQNITIIEDMHLVGSRILYDKITFPFVVCLNQECDLENDYNNKGIRNKDSALLHLAIAPAFNFEDFLVGKHWGEIFPSCATGKRDDTRGKALRDNEVPRFHYLKFAEQGMPELIIDFKHFFTINREVLYSNIDKRMCSLDDLYREKISQRFSYYISRIGLPE